MDTKQLQKRIEELERENALLKQDKAFGGLTRQALDIEFILNDYTGCYAIFCDLDKIHSLNELYGYEQVDERIRTALSIRHDDMMFFGRWKSGDEIVFLVCNNPAGFVNRIQSSLVEHGLSGTFAWEQIKDNNLFAAVQTGVNQVQAVKKARGHSR